MAEETAPTPSDREQVYGIRQSSVVYEGASSSYRLGITGLIDGDAASAAGTYALSIGNGSGTITLGNVGVTTALKSLTLTGTGSTFVGSINTTNGYSLGSARGITLTVDTTYVNPNDPVVLGNVTLLDGVTLTLGNGGPALITVNSVTGTASGTFADKNVGSGKTVMISGLSLTGADASNYSLTTPTTTATITAKSITLSGLS